jgi:hypothetical protein
VGFWGHVVRRFSKSEPDCRAVPVVVINYTRRRGSISGVPTRADDDRRIGIRYIMNILFILLLLLLLLLYCTSVVVERARKNNDDRRAYDNIVIFLSYVYRTDLCSVLYSLIWLYLYYVRVYELEPDVLRFVF